MANSKIEEAAEAYAFVTDYKIINALDLHDAVNACRKDFIAGALSDAAKEYWYEQFKAEQKQVFPLPSEWINEFKKAWYRDNDVGVLSKTEIKDMWDKTERVCNMIYQYQRRAFEAKQQKQVPTNEEIEKMSEKEYPDEYTMLLGEKVNLGVYARTQFIKGFKSALQFNNTSPDL